MKARDGEDEERNGRELGVREGRDGDCEGEEGWGESERRGGGGVESKGRVEESGGRGRGGL